MQTLFGTLTWQFLLIGCVLVGISIVGFLRKLSTPVISLFLFAGLFLTVISDPSRSCKVGIESVECKHGDPAAATAVADATKSFEVEQKHTTAPEASPTPSPPSPTPPPQPLPARGTVVMIYKDEQRDRAQKLVSAFLAGGYKSSAVNSSLSEVSAWVDDKSPGAVYVAEGDEKSTLGRSITALVQSTLGPNQKVVTEGGWALVKSDAQVFLY